MENKLAWIAIPNESSRFANDRGEVFIYEDTGWVEEAYEAYCHDRSHKRAFWSYGAAELVNSYYRERAVEIATALNMPEQYIADVRTALASTAAT